MAPGWKKNPLDPNADTARPLVQGAREVSNETPAGGAVWKNPGIRDICPRGTENSPEKNAFHVIPLTEFFTAPIPSLRKFLPRRSPPPRCPLIETAEAPSPPLSWPPGSAHASKTLTRPVGRSPPLMAARERPPPWRPPLIGTGAGKNRRPASFPAANSLGGKGVQIAPPSPHARAKATHAGGNPRRRRFCPTLRERLLPEIRGIMKDGRK